MIDVEVTGVAGASFRRGDVDTDSQVSITDAINALNQQFLGTFESPCDDAADTDDNGKRELADAINILNQQFLGTFVIPPPNECGPDATPDDLGCESFAPCD